MEPWILLADDDPEDRFIIKEAMDQVHARQPLTFVENGEQVLTNLSTVRDENNYPCLIVLDLNMPKMNGKQTLRHLKSDNRYKTIPVIIYSTSINPFEMEICMQLGAHSYDTKPISIKESIDTAKIFFRFCEDAF